MDKTPLHTPASSRFWPGYRFPSAEHRIEFVTIRHVVVTVRHVVITVRHVVITVRHVVVREINFWNTKSAI